MNNLERDFVTGLYAGFMGRAPDESGLEYWGGVLATARPQGRTIYTQAITDVLHQFEYSVEFGQVQAAMIALAPEDPTPSYDVDIRGNPIPSPSGPAGAQMGEYPGNPPFPGNGGGPCGAYEVALGNASAGMTGINAITRAWLYVLEDIVPGSPRLGNSMHLGVPRSHAFAFRFKTGPASAYPSLAGGANVALTISSEEQYTHGPLRARFMVLSEKIFDFDYSKIGVDGAYVALPLGGSLLGAIVSGGIPPLFPYATLKPDTTYYLSMRFEDATNEYSRGRISAEETAVTVGQTIGIQCNG